MMLKGISAAVMTALCLVGIGFFAGPAAATPPVIEETYDFVTGDDWDKYGDWSEWPSGPTDFIFAAMQNDVEPELCPNDECGLLVAAAGPESFSSGDMGIYYINPPGYQEAYIKSVQVDKWAYYKNDPLEGDDPRAVFGTASDESGFDDDAEYFTDQTVNGSPLSFTGGGPDTQAFGFGLVSEGASSISDVRAAYAGEITLRYGDNDDPELSVFSSPKAGSWVSEQPFDATIEAKDYGLGLLGVEVTTPLAPPDEYSAAWVEPCAGTHADRCLGETPANAKVTIEPSELLEGSNTLTAKAWDVYDRSSDPLQMSIKVDKSDPGIDLDGTFMSAPSMTLTGGSYGLDVDATDGDLTDPNSGVVALEVKIDNSVIASDSQSCATQNCSLDLHPTINSSSYSNGSHQLKVKATDAVGHVKTTTVDFEVDR